MIIHGLFTIFYGVKYAFQKQQWRTFITPGIMHSIVGGVMLVAPYILSIGLALFLWIMIASALILIGAFGFDEALHLRQDIKNECLLMLTSLLFITPIRDYN